MTMRTRCPACDTVFRVTPAQLKAKQGKVRCGQCQHVFNALDTLVDTAPAGAAEAAPAAEVPAEEPRITAAGDAAREPTEAVETLASVESDESGESAESVESAENLAQPATDMLLDIEVSEGAVAADAEPTAGAGEEETAAESISEPTAGPGATPASDRVAEPAAEIPAEAIEEAPAATEPEPEEQAGASWPPATATQVSRGHPVWWTLAVLLALTALLYQAALQFRTELAVLAPESKPLLEALCLPFDCTVPLPQKINQLSIEASELHPDPLNKAQLVLAATLKNHAPFAQAYPFLEVTLTDTDDKAVVRKILAPADYLPKETNATEGFATNGETVINLTLVPDASLHDRASGYRLYLFYP